MEDQPPAERLPGGEGSRRASTAVDPAPGCAPVPSGLAAGGEMPLFNGSAGGTDDAAVLARTDNHPARPPVADSSDAGFPGACHAQVEGGRPAADRVLVRLLMPRSVAAAFDEALDLHRAVQGREETVTSFVEALVAEAISAGDAPDPLDGASREPLRRAEATAAAETAHAHSTNRWEHLPPVGRSEWAPDLAKSSLERLRELASGAERGDAAELDARMRGLLAIEDEIGARLGDLLARMADEGAWIRLRFDSAVHYAEERLGWGRSTARLRVRVARALRGRPEVKRAYESGSIGPEAAWLVARMSGEGTRDAESERAWLARASEATVKRLRDEARMAGRIRAGLIEPDGDDGGRSAVRDGMPAGVGALSGNDDGRAERGGRDRVAVGLPSCTEAGGPRLAQGIPTGASGNGGGRESAAASGRVWSGVSTGGSAASPAGWREGTSGECRGSRLLPLSDARWHAGLRRAVGTARQRVAALGHLAAGYPSAPLPGSDVFHRLRLQADVAADLLGAIEVARRRLERRAAEVEWDQPWPESDPPGSLRAAREFFVRCRRTPAWVGFLALLEDFVETWDVEGAPIRRPARRILERDGWRCAAPGCTSRRHLEIHHVRHRSRGGGDEESNVVVLCRFHHLLGEHGGLAGVRGRAPLDLVWWIGRAGIGGCFVNERRTRADSGGERAVV